MLSTDDRKLALSLRYSSPVIFHFDDGDLGDIKIVELSENDILISHTVSPYHLYDSIADYLYGQLDQFIVSQTSTSRIYMVGSLESKMQKATQGKNFQATLICMQLDDTEDYFNVLWPIFHKHQVRQVLQQSSGFADYEIRGSAFFLKETRDEGPNPWNLCHLTPEEVQKDLLFY